MRLSRTTVAALAVLMCGVFVAESAFAQRSRVRVGIFVGVPLIGFGYHAHHAHHAYYLPPYYHPPYYYYPPYYPAPVVVQQQPIVYVEQPAQQQQPAAAQPQTAGHWYYCADSRAYYPYVKECPAGWQRVAPQPG